MIEVENLTKYFGPILAVDDISFQVAKGEIVGFLGPNGAGKTTTIRVLTSYLPATSGVARIANHDVMKESMAVRQAIGYLPESVPLYPEMRVDEYLLFRAKLKGVDRKSRPGRLDYCLDRCRVREVRRRLIGTLSKGYRQRVGLADAMIHDPSILILDEPTTGLDPLQIRETLTLIKELGDQHTILLSTHILAEVSMVCTRVAIIDHGRLIACDTVSGLLQRLEGLIRIRVPQLTPGLRERIKKLPSVRLTEQNGQRLELECRDVKRTLLQLVSLLNELQLELTSLETEEPNLERVFLHLTGRALRD